ESRLAISGTVGGRLSVRRRRNSRSWSTRERAQLFDRAKADPISLAQGAIDGASFGNTQLRAPDRGRNVRGIGISIANETLGIAVFIDDSFEDPATRGEIGELGLECGIDSAATSAGSKL